MTDVSDHLNQKTSAGQKILTQEETGEAQGDKDVTLGFMTLEGTLENQQEEGRHTVGTTGRKTGQACHKQKNAQKLRSTPMELMRKNGQSTQQSHSRRLQV